MEKTRLITIRTSSHHSVDIAEFDDRQFIDGTEGMEVDTKISMLLDAMNFFGTELDEETLKEVGDYERLRDLLTTQDLKSPENFVEYSQYHQSYELNVQLTSDEDEVFVSRYITVFNDTEDEGLVFCLGRDLDKYENHWVHFNVVNEERLTEMREKLNELSREELIDRVIINTTL